MNSLIQIHTTYPNLTAAQSAGEQLVQQHLVACAQVEPIQSIYEWDDEIESESEVRLVLKTLNTHFENVASWIDTHHPYDVPQITATPITYCSESYAHWVQQQCTKKPA